MVLRLAVMEDLVHLHGEGLTVPHWTQLREPSFLERVHRHLENIPGSELNQCQGGQREIQEFQGQTGMQMRFSF